MDFLLQYQSRSRPDDSYPFIIGLIGVIIIVGIIWQVVKNKEYEDAKLEFQRDPNDSLKKQSLIDAARYRGNKGSKSALDVISVIQEAEDVEKRRQKRKGVFVTELESLAKLHKEGALTDEEFEQAKTRLLK